MKRIWHFFISIGPAPVKWHDTDIWVVRIFEDIMCRDYPELALGECFWKVHEIAHTDYPSWHAKAIARLQPELAKELEADRLQKKVRGQKRYV
jgi:hypothetical protein